MHEETAIVLDRNADIFDVFGNGTVTFLDARRAKIGKNTQAENWSREGLRTLILRAVDRFDWRIGPKIC